MRSIEGKDTDLTEPRPVPTVWSGDRGGRPLQGRLGGCGLQEGVSVGPNGQMWLRWERQESPVIKRCSVSSCSGRLCRVDDGDEAWVHISGMEPTFGLLRRLL